MKNLSFLLLLFLLVSCDADYRCLPRVQETQYPCADIVSGRYISSVVYDSPGANGIYDAVSFHATVDSDSIYHFHTTDWYDFTQGIASDTISYAFFQKSDTLTFIFKKNSFPMIYEKRYVTSDSCMIKHY